MHDALLSTDLGDLRVICNLCYWRCEIAQSHFGVCRMYKNINGKLYNMNYALASSVAVDPIEKKPLYHFYPGSQVFSLGSWGCNFHCTGCQNWQISCSEVAPVGRGSKEISPAKAVDATEQNDCGGIAWTYNEPTMWFEYTLDSARLAKERDFYTVYVTNGYMTLEALDMIGPYLDAWRVDVKGYTDQAYKQIAKITHRQDILKTAERAKNKWNMHIEVITNIIPGINDDDSQLRGLAAWIRNLLGDMTPWHVTRFYPQYEMMDYPATPLDTLERAIEIGYREGLKFVYTGNIPGHKNENTYCYRCNSTVIERNGYDTRLVALNGSKCGYCGAELNIKRKKGDAE